MITEKVSKRILTVGIDFRDHRGGIGGVIATYSKYFSVFNFIPSYKPQRYKFLIISYFLINLFRFLALLITNKEIKIVHIHGAAKGSLFRKFIIFIISKYVFKRKVIYHSHGSEFKLFYNQSTLTIKSIIRFFLDNVDLVICLSKQWEIFFRENFLIKDITILENIIEESPTCSTPCHNNTVIKLLFLGFIGYRKGVFDLLEALNDNKINLEGKLQLTIGGNGEEERLKSYISRNKLDKLVKFEGWVTGQEKNNLLKNSDLYILPSYNEGLPLSILEAMSYGLPIISTPVGGTPEVVKEGINGFLIQPGDKVAIYNAIKHFIADPSLLIHMGASSKTIIQPYYTKNVIPKLQKIYEKLLIENI